MPYIVILLIHRKPGLTAAEFRHHYEKTHVPLIKSLSGSLILLSHTRRYAQPSSEGHGAADNGIDCVTEMQLNTASDFTRLSEFLFSPAMASGVQRDYEAFMDSSKTDTVIIGNTVKTLDRVDG